MKKNLSYVLAGVLGGFASVGVMTWVNKYTEKEPIVFVEKAPIQSVHQMPSSLYVAEDFTKASESTVNAVVHIQTLTEGRTTEYRSLQDLFFGNPFQGSRPRVGSGSGVIISEDGYIVTNNHVIDGANEIEVTLNDRRHYKASVIGTDPSTDLALLQIEEKGLPFVPFGNSDQVKVGEWVLAVGNPFNLNSTVTAGIVSAKSRKIDIIHKDLAIESFIQTDAAVNPGNSGGALVNTAGELVGINSAIASNTGSFTGYSFAIPANLVEKIVNDLARFGSVQRAFLGVSIRDIDSKFAKEKGLGQLNGVYINEVNEGGAALEGGLKSGDIITGINGKNTFTVSELQEQIGLFRPDDKVEVRFIRAGREQSTQVKLKGNTGQKIAKISNEKIMGALGAEFEPVKNQNGIKKGLKVSAVGPGKFRAIGIKEGYIILSVNKMEVGTSQELDQALSKSDGMIYIEGIYPNGTRAYYTFGM